MIGVQIAEDGSVIAQYSNNRKEPVGKIALAVFPDEGSLIAESDTSWTSSPASGEPLFFTPGEGMLNQLDLAIEALQAPGATANDPAVRSVLVGTLNGLDDGLDAVSAKIARLGGAQTTLETMETNHTNVSLSNQQALITFGQLDYGDAAVKLNGFTTAVQATQKAYAKVSTLSLFDAL